MANKIDKAKLINEIKQYPIYAGYNFDDFIGVQTMTVSKKIICNRNHEYTNSLSKLKNKARCKQCTNILARILSDDEYALLLSIKDINGNSLILQEQIGQMRMILPNNENVPGRAERITIGCHVHGNFVTSISELLRIKTERQRRGCPSCINKGASIRSVTIDEFILRAQNIHKNDDGTPKYDYSESIMRGMNNDITIKCMTHGYFTQTASSHVNEKNNNGASGCPECGWQRGADKNRHTAAGFVNISQLSHVNEDGTPKYDYSKSYIDPFTGKLTYTTVNEKVRIICPVHGEFQQNAYDHMSGRRGCTYCHESEGENTIWLYLKSMGVVHVREHTMSGMIHKGPLKLDFYLTNFNAAIEFNGEQHYDVKYCRGGPDEFKENMTRDAIKYKYCEDNGIKLLIIKYDEDIHMKIDEFLPTLVKID